MRETLGVLTKGELKFWIPIIGTIVGVAIAFTSMNGKINAMYDKGVALRADYEGTHELLVEVRESQIRIEKDIEFIKLILEEDGLPTK